MESRSHRSLLGISLLALLLALPLFASTAAAQIATDPTPREAGAALEDNLRYGHSAIDGSLALAIDNIATFCPDAPLLAVASDHRDEALKQLNAKDLGDGSWAVPDPDTGEAVVAKVQYASAVYDDGSSTPESVHEQKLPILDAKSISIAPILWPRCWAIRLNHICGNWGSCGPFGCLGYYQFSQVRNFLVCRPQRGSLCLEFLAPVCRLNQYYCRDCSGAVINSWPNYRWVCAVF